MSKCAFKIACSNPAPPLLLKNCRLHSTLQNAAGEFTRITLMHHWDTFTFGTSYDLIPEVYRNTPDGNTWDKDLEITLSAGSCFFNFFVALKCAWGEINMWFFIFSGLIACTGNCFLSCLLASVEHYSARPIIVCRWSERYIVDYSGLRPLFH